MIERKAVSDLITLCVKGDGSPWELILKAAKLVGRENEVANFADVDAYMDAAIALLPREAVWRKYTDRCFTVYGASPFNAAAQERFDAFGDCDPLTLTAAFLRMHFAKLLVGKNPTLEASPLEPSESSAGA